MSAQRLERSLTVEPDPAAVRTARDFVYRTCTAAGLDDDTCSSAVLLSSELVTNAFIHGRSQARVRVVADPTSLRVEVGDDNSRHPAAQEEDADALDGRGMVIVGLVARSWGVADDPYGKVVWFELDGLSTG